YVVNVAIGSPASTYSLIVDTGSSNTWIGADKSFHETNTSILVSDSVAVSYGSGFFEGAAFVDQVALSDDLVAYPQIIGVAGFSFGFAGYDGILGLGPPILTNGTVSNFELVDTVVDVLYYEGHIQARVLGAALAPLNANGGVGSLAFGAPDPSQYTGLLSYTNVTKAYPSSLYFGIDLRFDYGPRTIGYGSGIVDVGTTLILLASDIYEAYANSTGGVYDYSVGLLRLDEEEYNRLQPLNLRINGATYELTSNAQILPRTLNVDVGGDEDAYYLIVADLGYPSGFGLDFILGQCFLERFYSVYDSGQNYDNTDSRVGFAETKYSFSETN
ncbi:acid protease, partial [Exidia glandulosa HHB12029]